jgi:hypothetical protein
MSRDDEVKKIVNSCAASVHGRSGVDCQKLVDLLDAGVGRLLRRAGAPDFVFDTLVQAGVYHFGDWLASEILSDAQWIGRVNPDGVPLKLAKAGNFDQLLAEVEKSELRRRTRSAPIGLGAAAEKVFDAGDGFGVYRLTSKEELDREGAAMGHCVGGGAYDLGVENGSTSIYSLRDGHGKSHATIEINTVLGSVEQIKGKQNRMPKPEYMRRLVGWLGPDVEIDKSDLPQGFAVDAKVGLVELAALREGEIFHGDVDIRYDSSLEKLVFPLSGGVRVSGNLSIDGGDIIDRINRSSSHHPTASTRDFLPSLELPRGLHVDGNLKVRGCDVSAGDLEAGSIHFVACLVSRLPPVVSAPCEFESTYSRGVLGAVTFNGDVTMERCNDFSFGDGTRIEGDLCVSVSELHSAAALTPSVRIGSGTSVGGEVRITSSCVKFEGAFIAGGDMSFYDCGSIFMPNDLTVGGGLSVRETFIDRWPETMDVTGQETYIAVDSHGERDTVPPGFVAPRQPSSAQPRFR